jgi:predicted ATPase with chaperone activity
LAPADVRKEDSSLDLPIALGVLAATGRFAAQSVAGIVSEKTSIEHVWG